MMKCKEIIENTIQKENINDQKKDKSKEQNDTQRKGGVEYCGQ